MDKSIATLHKILNALVVMNSIWLINSALNIVRISLYRIIPDAIYSLLSVISDGIHIFFYIMLISILPALKNKI